MQSDALKQHIAAMRANPYSPDKSVAQLRTETQRRASSPLPNDISVTPVEAEGISGEWVQADNARPRRTILFLHGGGYYRGSISASRSGVAALARSCAARCLSLSYRLAPEHPYPAALEDTVNGYQWLLRQGIAAGNIAICGISAGGGLAVATLLALRNAGLPLPAAAIPLSPWLDLTQSSESFQTRAADDPFISKPYLDRMAGYYAAGADPRDPLISPLFGDLADLPPMLVHVGSLETMHDESIAFAHACQAAGGSIEIKVWPGLVHGWHAHPELPETIAALREIAVFCRQIIPDQT